MPQVEQNKLKRSAPTDTAKRRSLEQEQRQALLSIVFSCSCVKLADLGNFAFGSFESYRDRFFAGGL